MKYSSQHRLRSLALVASLSLLTACGGGSDDEETASTGNDEGGIIGTAKIIVKDDSKVETKSKSGQKLTASINSQGKYKLANPQAEAYLLRTERPATNSPNTTSNAPKYLYSIAHSDGTKQITRNLHPYTDLIIRNWFASHSLDINQQFNSKQPITKLPSVAEVNAIEAEIEGIVSKVLIDYGVKNQIDLIATPFDINGKGFDKFLDNNSVIINSDGKVTIVFKQNTGQAVNVGVNQLNLNTNLTTANDNPPTEPTNLNAYPQSGNKIVIRWKASKDDKGVAGYAVYRNGTQIATTPYPLYIDDKNLSTSQSYRYQVQAIDGRGQTSAKTNQTSPVTPASNVIVALNGVYDVVTTSTSIEGYCSGSTGTFTLTNDTDITGSVTADTNSNYVFTLNGKRDKNTAAVSGGFATTQGITYASIKGVIDSINANGSYEDIRGCVGVWVATKQ